jgi:adhesin HecA-like repeat protein
MKPTDPSNIFIVDPGTINQSTGHVTFALTLLDNETGKIGSGVLATVQFAGLTTGISLLEIRDAFLGEFSSDQYSLGQGSVKVMQLISIAEYNRSFGENVTVEVLVEPASTIVGGSFDICFDESVVNAVSLSSGDFGEPVYVIDNDAGVIEATTEGAAVEGKDVAVLARVTFRETGDGFTVLQLQKAIFEG